MMRSWSLVEVIEKVGVEDFFDKPTRQRKLVIFLLRNGYIDEMYPTYITYFYPGSLTQKDMNFIMSIKDQETLEPSYQLIKVEKIINRLTRGEFERSNILNYNLIDYILENHHKYNEYIETIIVQLSDESETSIAFIDSFIDITRNKELFVNLLCSSWFNIWSYILNKSNFPEAKKDEYLKNIILFGNLEDINAINTDAVITNYISRKADFVNMMAFEKDITKIEKVIKELNVEFEKLDNPIENNELMEFIFENSLYAINVYMIDLIAKVKFPEQLQDFSNCNYTTINKTNYLPLVNYIDENLKAYINNVFIRLENNNHESKETIIDLLNNEELSQGEKYKIIEKEKTLLDNIEDINSELWFKVIKECKITVSWVNIMAYYNSIGKIDEALASFISVAGNYKVLALSKFSKDGSFEDSIYKGFSKDLIYCEYFDEDVFINLTSSIPYKYNKIDISALSDIRVNSIINCNLLNFTLDNFNAIRENYKALLVLFIEKDIAKFLEEWATFEVDSMDLINILNSKNIAIDEKAIIIRNIDNVLLNGNFGLMELICEILILCDNIVKVNIQVVKEIISSKISDISKIQFFNRQIIYLGTNEISDCLVLLGDPYKSITINKKKPLINNSAANSELLQRLRVKGYIASFSREKNGFRVYTKQK